MLFIGLIYGLLVFFKILKLTEFYIGNDITADFSVR